MSRLAAALFLLSLGLGWAGCRKKAAAPDASVPPATEVAANFGIQPADLPDQQTLYNAITKYMAANQGRAASGVNELVEKGYLKPLPPLPAGKRYHLDQRSAVLKIGD